MSSKWHWFLIGLLTGLVLSGFIILLISTREPSFSRNILPESNSSSTESPGTGSSETNEGKININTATIEELSSLPGIGPSKAGAIIEFREKYGLFESIEDLLYVPGIGESLYSSIKEEIFLE